MHNYQTKILEETAKEPTKLDLERIINQRIIYPSKADFYSLKNKEAGELGEQIVFNYLKQYGNDDWIVIKNMWMNYGGPFEGDLILLTNHSPYLIEVKNYDSDYMYKNGVSTWNDNVYSGNPVNQTLRNTINLHNIFNGVKVQGVLMLVGIDNHVEINSKVSEIDIIERNDLKYYINKIVEKEAEYTGQPLNKERLMRSLVRHEVYRLQNPQPLPANQLKRLRKGIYCLHCKSFDVEIGRKEISCVCGFIEEREIAILRTICEYGVLTFNENLKVGKLVEFLDGRISRRSIRNVLTKYFVEIRNASHTSYINRVLPLHKLYEELKLTSSIEVTLSHQEYDKVMRRMQQIEKAIGWIN